MFRFFTSFTRSREACFHMIGQGMTQKLTANLAEMTASGTIFAATK